MGTLEEKVTELLKYFPLRSLPNHIKALKPIDHSVLFTKYSLKAHNNNKKRVCTQRDTLQVHLHRLIALHVDHTAN